MADVESDEARSKVEPSRGRPVEPSRNEPSRNEPTTEEKRQEQPALWRRHPFWIAGAALLVLVLGAVGYLAWLAVFHPFESTDDAFVDARSFSIAPKVSGYIVDVPVTDNQLVEAGHVLFQIDRRDYDVALAQAEAQVADAQASIQTIDARLDAQRSLIAEAQAQVEQSQAALQFALDDAARYQELAETGSGTTQRSEQATSTLEQRQADMARVRAALDAARQQVGVLRAQRAGDEAVLAEYRATRDRARLDLGYTTVAAAQAGRMVNLTGAKGMYAEAGQSLSMFVPTTLWVTANFKESQLTDMRPGQPVAIEIDAYPDREMTGRVDSVQPGSGTAFSVLPAQNATGNYVKVVQRVPVKINVDHWPTDVQIGPGMSIVPTVQVRPRPAFYDWFTGE